MMASHDDLEQLFDKLALQDNAPTNSKQSTLSPALPSPPMLDFDVAACRQIYTSGLAVLQNGETQNVTMWVEWQNVLQKLVELSANDCFMHTWFDVHMQCLVLTMDYLRVLDTMRSENIYYNFRDYEIAVQNGLYALANFCIDLPRPFEHLCVVAPDIFYIATDLGSHFTTSKNVALGICHLYRSIFRRNTTTPPDAVQMIETTLTGRCLLTILSAIFAYRSEEPQMLDTLRSIRRLLRYLLMHDCQIPHEVYNALFAQVLLQMEMEGFKREDMCCNYIIALLGFLATLAPIVKASNHVMVEHALQIMMTFLQQYSQMEEYDDVAFWISKIMSKLQQ